MSSHDHPPRVGALVRWWRQPDHYDELSSHLRARGLATAIRAAISTLVASSGVIGLATIWSTTGPRGGVQITCVVGASAGAAIAALVWVRRWPTRCQAIRFTLLCNSSAAVVTLAQNDPAAGLAACATFVALAGYIALFHTPALKGYNFAVATVTCAVVGVRLTSVYGVMSAVCACALMLLVNLTVPMLIQVVVYVLGIDAVRGERDQLTGLLTRGAFHRRAKALLKSGRDQSGYVVITVIDLDRFKQLNDTYGHSAGDDALVCVARALRHTAADTAVIGRSGGEEFVVADTWQPDDVGTRAQQLCDAIGALPLGVTASVGTAGIHPAYRADESADLLAELITAADEAMYAAKRRGGNQTGHHRWPLPPRLDSFAADDITYRRRGLTA